MSSRVLCTHCQSQESRILCTHYQSQGKALNPSNPLHLGIWVAKENRQLSIGWNNALYMEKRQSKISFSLGHWSLTASRALPVANIGQFAYAHPSAAIMVGACPLPANRYSSSGVGQMPYDWRTWFKRRQKEYSLRLKQGKIFPHKVVNPAQAVWALCLLVRKCSSLWAHSYVAEWGSIDCRHKTSLLNTWLAWLLFPSLLWLLRSSELFYFLICIFSLSQFSELFSFSLNKLLYCGNFKHT